MSPRLFKRLFGSSSAGLTKFWQVAQDPVNSDPNYGAPDMRVDVDVGSLFGRRLNHDFRKELHRRRRPELELCLKINSLKG